VFSECRKCYFRHPPPSLLVPAVLCSNLWRLHTMLGGGGGGQGKWALWQFCPTTEESLKNALRRRAFARNVEDLTCIIQVVEPFLVLLSLPTLVQMVRVYTNETYYKITYQSIILQEGGKFVFKNKECSIHDNCRAF
jgi:hypothetical protein